MEPVGGMCDHLRIRSHSMLGRLSIRGLVSGLSCASPPTAACSISRVLGKVWNTNTPFQTLSEVSYLLASPLTLTYSFQGEDEGRHAMSAAHQ